MHCSDIESKFDRYLDGDLRTTERLCLAVHLSQCYTCRETLDEYKFLNRAISSGLRHPNPVSRFPEVLARVRLNDQAKRPRFHSRFHPWYMGKRFILAAGLVLTTALSAPWLLDALTPGKNVDGIGRTPGLKTLPYILRPLTDRAQSIATGEDLLPRAYDRKGPPKTETAETPDAPL